MRASDPVISVKISDIVDVYNTLVINKEVKWVEGADRSIFAEPLESLRQELGDEVIQLTEDENTAIASRQMNLRIKCRFLGVTNKMVMCKKCSSPVTEAMVPRF